MPVVTAGSVRHQRTDPKCCQHRPPRTWAYRLRARLGRRRCALCAFAMNGGMVEGTAGVAPACSCFIRGRR